MNLKEMRERLETTNKNLQKLTYKELTIAKNFMIFLVVVDLFLVFWYLGLKKLGMALLIVFLIIFAVILFLLKSKEPDKPKKMGKSIIPAKKEDKKKMEDIFEGMNQEETEEEVEEETTEESLKKKKDDFGLGEISFPSSEEYQKNLNEAFGA